MDYQRVNLFEPMIASRKGPPPIALKVGVHPDQIYTMGGTVNTQLKVETYVLLSVLPADLRLKVENAIAALSSGM